MIRALSASCFRFFDCDLINIKTNIINLFTMTIITVDKEIVKKYYFANLLSQMARF